MAATFRSVNSKYTCRLISCNLLITERRNFAKRDQRFGYAVRTTRWDGFKFWIVFRSTLWSPSIDDIMLLIVLRVQPTILHSTQKHNFTRFVTENGTAHRLNRYTHFGVHWYTAETVGAEASACPDNNRLKFKWTLDPPR